MPRNILMILGHPKEDSLCGSIFNSYKEGAEESGAKIRVTYLRKMRFDPVLEKGYDKIQSLEPSLKKFQRDLEWADHVVFVFPTWWASIPAKLKGLLDRTILPGFAFNYKSRRSLRWDAYLKGKSARLLITMDAPPLYHKIIVGSPGYKLMKDTLGFCGIKPVRRTFFGSVKLSSDKRRERWIRKSKRLGKLNK